MCIRGTRPVGVDRRGLDSFGPCRTARLMSSSICHDTSATSDSLCVAVLVRSGTALMKVLDRHRQSWAFRELEAVQLIALTSCCSMCMHRS